MACGPGWYGWSGWRAGGFGFPLGIVVLGLVAWAVWTAARRPPAQAMGVGTCPRCSRTVDALWAFCPLCGQDLGARNSGA
ncbi:MAG: hypothetical protein HY900_04280 [Deltaproteobacteria bacterium]|nr:hypothetical protein [Deltaproteobacteria bacterium]